MRKLRRLGIGYRPIPKSGETIYTNVCKLKQKVELENWKNVVYSVECETCGLNYIGETGQHYCDRRDQHKSDINQRKTSNALYDHKMKNEGHKINWEKVCFLDKEKNWKGRKIKEAIYINAIVPTTLMDNEF